MPVFGGIAWAAVGCGRIVAALGAALLVLLPALTFASEGEVIGGIDVPPDMGASFVRDEQGVSIIDFQGNMGRFSADGETNAGARVVLAREFFDHHADDYDFLFFYSLFEYEMGDAVAFHMGVRNDVSGIGRPLYDNSLAYGSDGRLLGTIDMGSVILDQYQTDPTDDSHDNLISTAMHELLHQWGISVDFIDPETGERSAALRGKDDSHWSSLLHTSGSVEYGAKWVDNGDGSFTAVAERLFYSPLDLYLMGMAPPEEVPPLFLIEDSNQTIDPEAISVIGETVTGQRKDITISDIVAAEGPREPSWQDAQKSFNAAFILVKRPGQDVPPEVYGRINTLRESTAQRFAILTGGRGMMHVHSRVRPLADVGVADGASEQTDDREGEYKLGDALSWLRSAQLAGGNWQDTHATALRDSLMVNAVLSDLDPLYDEIDRVSFRAWLQATESENNDDHSRLVIGRSPALFEVLPTLTSAQNGDGGWGLTARHESSPLDTALAVQALHGQPGNDEAIAKGIAYLWAVQNEDGGWGAVSNGPSQVGITAQVLFALQDAPQGGSLEQASVWLGARQQVDGGVGNGEDRIATTAQVLWALADASLLDAFDANAAVAFLHDQQGTNGSWDNSVFNTAVAVKALGRVQFGNLNISNLQNSSDAIYDGQRLSLTADIRNDSNVFVPSATVALYLGDPENGGVLLDTLELSAIGVGQGVQVTFDWDSYGHAGEQNFYVVVDPDNILEERTELDNVGELPITVTPPAEGVDLVAGRIAMVPSEVSSLPQQLGLSTVVRNAGTQTANDIEVQWWVESADDTELLQTDHVSLEGRSDIALTTNYSWGTTGARTFRVVIDPTNAITEIDEKNNRTQRTERLVETLDLAVSADDIQLLNTPAYGQTLDARVTLHNQGTVDSPPFTVTVSLQGEDHTIPLDELQTSLAAGQARTLEVPWLVDQVGDFSLKVSIDVDQQVAERNEDNNQAEHAFTASVVAGNNLQVSHETLAVEPALLLEGYGATLKAVVRNTGNQAANNVAIRFYNGKPDESGEVISEVTLPEIPPASEATAEGLWSRVDGSADKSVYVVVDPDGVIDEFDETDNQAFKVVTVQSLPDLAVGEGAIQLSPPLVAEGETFQATVTVTNLGSQPAENAKVSLYWDGVDPNNLIAEKVMNLAGNGEGQLVFDLVSDAPGERVLHVAVDVENTIDERQENNNSTSANVVAQNGQIYIDTPYISPNGDGVKDTVTVVFRIDYPEGSFLSVEGGDGKKVRNILLDSLANGSVVWDGRNQRGGIVDDGGYRLIIRSNTGAALAAVPVIVDNNRAPITNALLEEGRGYRTDISCQLPTDNFEGYGGSNRWKFSKEAQDIVFEKNRSNYYPGAVNGIFKSDFSGADIRSITVLSEYPDSSRISFLGMNRKEDRIVYSVELDDGYPGTTVFYEKLVGGDEPGRLLLSLSDVTGYKIEHENVVYGKDDTTPYLLVHVQDRLALYNLSTGEQLQSWEQFNWIDSLTFLPNEDGSRLLLTAYNGDSGWQMDQVVALVDTETDSVTQLSEFVFPEDLYYKFEDEGYIYPWSKNATPSGSRFFCKEGEKCDQVERGLFHPMQVSWAPDGQRFVLTGSDQSLGVYDFDGKLLTRYELPRLINDAILTLSELVWSPDGTRLAFYYGGSFLEDDSGSRTTGGYLSILDLDSGDIQNLLPFYYHLYEESFHYQVWDGKKWIKRAETHQPRKLASRTASLGRHLPDAGGRYRVRVTQVGHEEAFVDQLVMLGRDGRPIRPVSVKILGEESRDITSALAKRDYAMVDFHGKIVELEWEASTELSGAIVLHGQEASPSKLRLRPFSYPDKAQKHYQVPLGAGSELHVDGKPDNDPGQLLFTTRSRPDTAHRPADVRGYARSDENFLYASLDFAVDSTEENRGDWAALEVKTAEGWRRFIIDADHHEWGRVAFTETREAPWKHRYYEFKVPLETLGLKAGSVAQIRFKAYGSAGITDESTGWVEMRRLIWLPSDDALLYTSPYDDGDAHVIRFRDEVTVEPVVADINASMYWDRWSYFPALFSGDARLSRNGAKLIYTDRPLPGKCNLDLDGDVVNQLYSFSSLDNLTADIRVFRAAGGSGFTISGTVTDAHFDRFTLMYSEIGNDSWHPIMPASNKQYLDEQITTWVPPEKGKYFVRLTAYDKAGNQVSVARRLVWSEQAPLTDIYVDQGTFSPNSDGRKDELGIHFTVREPINLSVQIYNGDNLVRTFDGAYDTIGEEVWLQWDGRDEGGRLVPDGDYRVVIMGVEYWVTVDNTFPEVSLGMSSSPFASSCLSLQGMNLSTPLYSARELLPATTTPQLSCSEEYKGENRFLALDYLLHAIAKDGDAGLTVEVEARKEGQEEWDFFDAGRSDSPLKMGLTENEVAGLMFRARATDLAGNESIVEYAPSKRGLATILRLGPYGEADSSLSLLGPEFYHLGEPVPYDAPTDSGNGVLFGPMDSSFSRSHITLSESIAEDVIAVHAEYKSTDETVWKRETISEFLQGDWQRCYQTVFTSLPECETEIVSDVASGGRIHLLWDLRNIQSADTTNELRFVLVTASENEIATPAVSIKPKTFTLDGFESAEIIESSSLVVSGGIYAVNDLGDITVYVKSKDDERYESERLLGSVPPSPTGFMNGKVRYEVDASDLLSCTEYSVRAVMRTTDGSATVIQQDSKTPCLKTLYRVQYPERLHDGMGDNISVIVWPVSLANTQLKSLEIYAPLSAGGKDVIATSNSLANGEMQVFELDTLAWPVGETNLAIRLVDELENEHVTNFTVYKDVEAPAIELASPLQGQSICGPHPFQVSYVDTAGPIGQGQHPEGWKYHDNIYSAIDQGGKRSNKTETFSSLLGFMIEPRSGLPLNALNLDNPANLPFSGRIQDSEQKAGNDTFAELLIEAVGSNGEVKQQFPLWDKKSMPDSAFPDLIGPTRNGRKLVFRDFVSLPWELSDESGGPADVTLRVTATDAYGNYSSLERAIEIDGAAAKPIARLGDGLKDYGPGAEIYLSPNGDGVQDSLTVNITNYESGSLELRLYPVHIENPDTDMLGVISLNEAEPGDYAIEWDGTNNGQALPDGRYRIEPVLRDSCGNISSVDPNGGHVTVVVDTQAPELTNVLPISASPLALTAQLQADIHETNLSLSRVQSIQQFYRNPESGEEVLLPHTIQVLSAKLAQYRMIADWNTHGLVGDYDLVWRVTDKAGNISEAVVPVKVQSKADLLSSMDVDTPYVSPNGDGRLDTLRYRVGVVEPINATVALQSAEGVDIEQIYSGALLSGDNALHWDGELASGTVPDGSYRISITAHSTEFPSLKQEVSRHFVVDSRPPTLDTPPVENGFLLSPFTLPVAIEDAAMGSYRVALEDSEDITVLVEGDGNLPLASLQAFSGSDREGGYVLDIQADDLAGNRIEQRLPFSLDLTAPSVSWIKPAISLVGGEGEERLPWSLVVDDVNPNQLRVTLESEAQEALLLYEGEGVSGDIGQNADIATLNGDYTLQATMTDLAGNETQVAKPLRIDREPPQAIIDAPAGGTFITGDFEVQGKVRDANLGSWSLSLHDSEGTLAEELAKGSHTQEGVLGSFSALKDGQYRLKLVAQDAVGYKSEYSSEITVDTTPPSAPAGLFVGEEQGGVRRLSWDASVSPDVAHYRLYDKGEQIAGPLTEAWFDFQPVADRPYEFAVVAVDHAGLESLPSEVLAWTEDTTGPSVSIGRPSEGELLAGLQDVIGSVTASDLKSYTVSVASTSAPENRRRIASSSLARRAETLTQWNTLDEQGDGEYRLELKAEDHAGNVSTVNVQVTLDNTPPAKPVNVQLAADDRNVTVSWDVSPSSDVKGYLIQRNGRVANADGPVIGDISPYLVEGVSYLDADVVDGDHEYAVYAVDIAGNVSEPAVASLALDLRAPTLVWVTPLQSEEFENNLVLHASSEDEDIALVRFRYRVSGDAGWSDLSPDVGNRPFQYSWSTQALPYGNYEIQAEAWDDGGRNALTPTLTVGKTDLTPPLPPADLMASVDQDAITLGWTASPSEDTAEYVVALVDEAADSETEIDRMPATDTSIEIPGLTDGAYRFVVRAVDTESNLSPPSPLIESVVFTPMLDDLQTVTLMDRLALKGEVVMGNTVNLYKVEGEEYSSLASVAVGSNGHFVLPETPLGSGWNNFALQAVTEDGGRSNYADVSVIRAGTPGKVQDLSYSYPDPSQPEQIRLEWQPPINAQDAFYLVRNSTGELLSPEAELTPVSYSTSSTYPNYGDPEYAFDGRDNWSFLPYDIDWSLDVDYGSHTWVSSIVLNWAVEPESVRVIAGMNDGVYGGESFTYTISQASKQDYETGEWVLSFKTPKPASALRLQVIGGGYRAELSEFTMYETDLTPQLYFDYWGDAKADMSFSVSAVSLLGMEGEAADIDVKVGDWQPPETVTLSGEASGSHALLSWTASVSEDVDAYLLYRDGEPVSRIESPGSSVTSHTDENVSNGSHLYQIRPLDMAGNLGDYSNVVTLTLEVAPPKAPTSVQVDADPLTGCIDLSWQEPELAPASYIIYRSEDGAEATEIARVIQTSYSDCNIYRDVDYSYHIVAVDEAGNSSGSSGSSSERGVDEIDPEPPVILMPAPEGRTFETDRRHVNVSGQAEVGATVVLQRDGFPVAETLVADLAVDTEIYENPDIYNLWLSPAGDHLAINNFDESIDILSWPSNDLIKHVQGDPDIWVWDVAWIDNDHFAVLKREGSNAWLVEVVSVADGSTRPLVYWPNAINVVNWYYDTALESLVAVVYDDDGEGRVSLLDPENGSEEVLISKSTDRGKLRDANVSPSGNKVLWGSSEYFVYDVENGESSPLPCSGEPLGWMTESQDPVLIDDAGIFSCLSDGSRADLFDDMSGVIDVYENVTSPSGYQFFLWESSGTSEATIRAFNGKTLELIGTIPYSPEKADSVYNLGFLQDKRIWAAYWDSDRDVVGLELSPYLVNFTFENIQVASGRNEINAYARDRFDNVSEPSGSIWIQAAETRVANLAVVVGSPQAMTLGYAAPLMVTVSNTGNVDMPATDLDVNVFTEYGDRSSLLNGLVPALNAGESHEVPLNWLANQSGQVIVEARVDVANMLNEQDRRDNRATATLWVADDQNVSLFVEQEGVTGQPGSSHVLGWKLDNPGFAGYQGELVASLASQAGLPIEELWRLPVSSLPAGTSLSGQQAFSIPAIQPGDYQLQLAYTSNAIDYPVMDGIPLQVEDDVRLDVLLSGGGQHYLANQSVPLTVDVAHSGTSGTLSSAWLDVRVMTPEDVVAEQWRQDLATLLPGDESRHAFAWSTGVYAPGDYRFEVNLRDDEGVVLLTQTYPFTIDGGVPQLAGSLALSSDVIGYQRPVSLSWKAENSGNIGLQDVSVHIEARRADKDAVVLLEEPLSLAVNESVERELSVQTTALDFGEWQVVLVADVSSEGNVYRHALSSQPLQVRDITAPAVFVSAPLTGDVINSQTTLLQALAADDASGMAALQWRTDGMDWQNMGPSEGGFSASLSALPEGEVTIRVRGLDIAGNVSEPAALTVRVDNTAPTLQLGGVQDGAHYADDVMPVVTAEDSSAVTVTKTVDGQPWDGSPIGMEGLHHLKVEAVDAASNQSAKQVSFTIDKTAPSVSFSGVTDGGLYNRTVTPSIHVDDPYLASSSAMLDGAAYESDTPVTEDGTYMLSAIATDKAGNQTMRGLAFTIDTVPPFAPSVTNIEPGEVIGDDITEVLGASEPGSIVELAHLGQTHSTVADASGHYLINGIEFVEGENHLMLVARDKAGNASGATELTFIMQPDNEPPVIQVNGVQDGGYYAGEVVIAVDITDESTVVTEDIRLNGVNYTAGTQVEGDGHYRLKVYAEDEYGNHTQYEANFTLDSTAPRITINGVNDGELYNSDITPVLNIDDLSPVTLTLSLNEQPYEQGSPVNTEGNHELLVQAEDAAGNQSSQSVQFALDLTVPTPPDIAVPEEGARVFDSEVEVIGTAEPGAWIELVLVDGIYTAQADPTGAFALSLILSDGEHRLEAVAEDAAGNRSLPAERTFSVLDAEVTLDTESPEQSASVLLWHSQQYADRQAWYRDTLSQHDITVTVVDNENDFRSELASERHNVMLLVSPGGELGQPLDMSADTVMRVRGSVASGKGLAWINTLPNLLETWHDMVGARTVSVLPDVDPVDYKLDEQTTLELAYQGHASVVSLLRGAGEGRVHPYCESGLLGQLECVTINLGDPDYPAAVANDYGLGTVKMLTFEPDLLVDESDAGRVLKDLVEDVTPEPLRALHHVPVAKGIRVSRVKGQAPLEVTVSGPAGVALLPGPDAESMGSNGARWLLDASAMEATLRYRLIAEYPGDFSIEAQVSDAESGTPLEQQHYPFNVALSDLSLISELQDAIEQERAARPLSLTLPIVDSLVEQSRSAYEQGNYEWAYQKLYLAMVKLRLMLDYNRDLMVLMGEYQRLLISRKS